MLSSVSVSGLHHKASGGVLIHPVSELGPVQPSMVYRYLRSLEGVSPPLMLIHLSCQMFAKNWLASRTSSVIYNSCLMCLSSTSSALHVSLRSHVLSRRAHDATERTWCSGHTRRKWSQKTLPVLHATRRAGEEESESHLDGPPHGWTGRCIRAIPEWTGFDERKLGGPSRAFAAR